MTEPLGKLPFIVDAETGARALVRAIEREPATAYVPRWPWWASSPSCSGTCRSASRRASAEPARRSIRACGVARST